MPIYAHSMPVVCPRFEPLIAYSPEAARSARLGARLWLGQPAGSFSRARGTTSTIESLAGATLGFYRISSTDLYKDAACVEAESSHGFTGHMEFRNLDRGPSSPSFLVEKIPW